MKRALVLCLVVSCIFLSGCKTVRNATVGTGITFFGIGKGIADDVYDTYKAAERADDWFAERYW